MGDRVCASIIIGGRLAAERLDAFLDLLEAEGLGPDWSERFEDRADLEAYVRDGAQGAAFYDTQAAGGEFDELQAFCAAHGLAYKLQYDGYGGGWGPATRIFGLDGLEISCSLDADGGEPCVSLGDIQLLGFTELTAVEAHLRRFAEYRSAPLVIEPT